MLHLPARHSMRSAGKRTAANYNEGNGAGCWIPRDGGASMVKVDGGFMGIARTEV